MVLAVRIVLNMGSYLVGRSMLRPYAGKDFNQVKTLDYVLLTVSRLISEGEDHHHYMIAGQAIAGDAERRFLLPCAC